jgi:hypothetical protein
MVVWLQAWSLDAFASSAAVERYHGKTLSAVALAP